MCVNIGQEIHLVCAVSLKGDHSTEIAVSKMSTHTHGRWPLPHHTSFPRKRCCALSTWSIFKEMAAATRHCCSLAEYFTILNIILKAVRFALPVSSYIIQHSLFKKEPLLLLLLLIVCAIVMGKFISNGKFSLHSQTVTQEHAIKMFPLFANSTHDSSRLQFLLCCNLISPKSILKLTF